MALEIIGLVIQWLGGLLTLASFIVVFYGIWRGTQRQVRHIYGRKINLLRSYWFYLASSILYFILCIAGWIPIPVRISALIRFVLQVFGAILFFPGMILILLGRLTLSDNYFVSSGFGVQLFSGHLLVTRGVYSYVRHPMYLGLILASIGSLFLYGTWTTLFFVFSNIPAMYLRSRREESALAAEFGEEWNEYARRVPAFFPRFQKEQHL